jgi:predicted transcriptional regulator
MAPLGELELRVMEAVWGHPPSTVREVADRMRESADRAYTTVMTTLDRLHKKGLLDRTKDRLAWRYAARLDRPSYERALADSLVAELLAEHGELALVAFVDAASAEPAVLERLAALIERRKRDP